MRVLPSMDLYAHKITRLIQGDFTQSKTYEDDPLAVLKSFEDAQAQMVHIVDLEATHTGENVHFDFIKNAAETLSIPLQVGGGIRSFKVAQDYLNAGIARIVLGSLALRDFDTLKELTTTYPGRIVVALDVKDHMVMSHGWTASSGRHIQDVITTLSPLDNLRYLITDIATDGMLNGPNIRLYETIKTITNVPLIASGGVTTCADIKALSALNIEEAVIGKAMYEGKLPLKEALKCSQDALSRA